MVRRVSIKDMDTIEYTEFLVKTIYDFFLGNWWGRLFLAWLVIGYFLMSIIYTTTTTGARRDASTLSQASQKVHYELQQKIWKNDAEINKINAQIKFNDKHYNKWLDIKTQNLRTEVKKLEATNYKIIVRDNKIIEKADFTTWQQRVAEESGLRMFWWHLYPNKIHSFIQ